MPARTLMRTAIVAVLGAMLVGLPAAAPAQITDADLSITKADSPDPVNVGSDLTYTITVRNDGPGEAPGVMVIDALALTTDFVSATATQGSCTEIALVVTCDLGALLNGASATVTLVVRPQAAGSLLNIAAAHPTPANVDSDPTDNVAVESTTVGDGSGSGADLAISKADAPDPVRPASALNYTATVQNVGEEPASGVTVTDILPVQATFVSATASQGSCTNPLPMVVLCDLGGLDPDASATVQIATTTGEEGTVANTATVVSTSFDPNPLNNASSTSTLVSATAPEPGTPGGTTGGPGGPAGAAACTIMGTPLNDVLTGTDGHDVICGLDGKDKIAARGGNDTVLGGKGNDRAGGSKGKDILKGQGGRDRLNGQAKKDKLYGGAKADRLRGGPGRDLLSGGGGKDRCNGKGDRMKSC